MVSAEVLTEATLLTRKQTAALLRCSDKFLDQHAGELGRQGEGRQLRYSQEKVLAMLAQKGVADLGQHSIDAACPDNFRASEYFSSRDVADLLGRRISSIPLSYYTLPGVFRDQEGFWKFPKQQINWQKHIQMHGNLLRRRGVAGFLKISPGTLKDAEERGELPTIAIGVKGFVEYSKESALTYVAKHYSQSLPGYLEALTKQTDVSDELKSAALTQAKKSADMLGGLTHFKTGEMAQILGLKNPYSLSAAERAALGAVSTGRDVYYPKESVFAEWFAREIARAPLKYGPNDQQEVALALDGIKSSFGAQLGYTLLNRVGSLNPPVLRVGAILAQAHANFLSSKDALRTESSCRATLLKELHSGRCSDQNLADWLSALNAVRESRPNLRSENLLLEQSFLVQTIALQTRLKNTHSLPKSEKLT